MPYIAFIIQLINKYFRLCGFSSCNVITKEVVTLLVENVTFPVENVTLPVVRRPKGAYKYLLITLILFVYVLVLCI